MRIFSPNIVWFLSLESKPLVGGICTTLGFKTVWHQKSFYVPFLSSFGTSREGQKRGSRQGGKEGEKERKRDNLPFYCLLWIAKKALVCFSDTGLLQLHEGKRTGRGSPWMHYWVTNTCKFCLVCNVRGRGESCCLCQHLYWNMLAHCIFLCKHNKASSHLCTHCSLPQSRLISSHISLLTSFSNFLTFFMDFYSVSKIHPGICKHFTKPSFFAIFLYPTWCFHIFSITTYHIALLCK